MKAVKIKLAGRERHLAFTVEAMFQIEETFGGADKLIETVMDKGRDGFDATCQAAAILAEQGELGRRALGYDPEEMPDAQGIAASLTPGELAAVKLAIPAAVSLGFGREVVPEDDEVDLALAELNAQKKHGEARPLPPHGGAGGVVPPGHAAVHPGGGGGPVGAFPAGPRGKTRGGERRPRMTPARGHARLWSGFLIDVQAFL